MHRLSTFLLSLLLSASCTRSRGLPLSHLDAVTRIEVRSPVGADSAHVITGADRVAKVVAALHAVDSDWQQSAITLPAGDAAVAFYRDAVLLGVVWLGRDYLVARGNDRTLIRSARPQELTRLVDVLEFPRKVIVVPPRGST